MWFYTGGYEKYVKQKTERREQLAKDYASQRDRIDQLEAFITRFRYQATKAKQVQSRVKELDRIDRIEVPEDEETIHFTFPQPPVSGRLVCEVSRSGQAVRAEADPEATSTSPSNAATALRW